MAIDNVETFQGFLHAFVTCRMSVRLGSSSILMSEAAAVVICFSQEGKPAGCTVVGINRTCVYSLPATLTRIPIRIKLIQVHVNVLVWIAIRVT